MKTLVLLLTIATATTAMAHHLERVWTDEKGRKTKAELLKIENNCAVLLLPDGREAPFPIEKLSKIDQAFIEKFELDESHDEEAKEEAPDLNFDDPWPDRVKFKGDPEIETVEEDADKKSFIYESANYRYNCDVRLSKSVVKGFAVMFEATHQFVRELPLAVNGGKKKEGKYQIFLFENKSDYTKAGGPPGSAGVFIGGKNIVMVPLTSLGVRPVGSGYMLDRNKSSKTLPHELVHQLTPNRYYAVGSMGWFTEGLAEYVATTPYRSGSYNVKTNFKPIVEYVTAYGKKGNGGRALGEKIDLGSLKRFMLQPYASFTSNAQVNYGCGLLITNYFFHMDRKEDGARIKGFLKALNDGKQGEEALEVLLDGQTFEEMEEEIAKAYSRKGVDFTFSN
ncbi:MAG: hypothetical protein IZT59_10640 [Verrucomicrobia bacterium]|nr:hypothetical protein [Verrucomicrobiota bacterium]|tara:strand:+ start:32071 stop:33252 length:1182 start_codon:yes stop_codon:yes gene_type:complete